MTIESARDRLLVIDDDDVFRHLVTRIAETADYEVMTTSDPVVSRAVVADVTPVFPPVEARVRG